MAALLSVEERRRILKAEGFVYSKKGITSFQKKYMKRKSDADGIWGHDTDRLARTCDNVRKNTKNFTTDEFACSCNGKYCCGFPDVMQPEVLRNIQTIRSHYGRPITVTEGLRCKKQNAETGGSVQNSGHRYGKAIDFYQKGVTDTLANRKKSLKWIKTLPDHKYSYGNGINSNGKPVNARNMGNARHTETK